MSTLEQKRLTVNAKKKAWKKANPDRVKESNKKYREANREKCLALSRLWIEQNREHYNGVRRDWYRVNSEKERTRKKVYREKDSVRTKEAVYNKAYRATNREKLRVYEKSYRQLNLEKIRIRENTHRKTKIANNVQFKLAALLRSRLWTAIKHGYKAGSAVRDMGCTIFELKIYLEQQFKKGMSWDNHGLWHIDHKIPLAHFDLTDRKQLLEAVHFTNLQPMWALDNQSKGAKI
jgi:hypothetical protein